jgi:hypothetical protein
MVTFTLPTVYDTSGWASIELHLDVKVQPVKVQPVKVQPVKVQPLILVFLWLENQKLVHTE